MVPNPPKPVFCERTQGSDTNMNKEIQALLDKARRYVRSAELLRADGDYNSAVSRLYYAMFYGAEAILLSKGLTFSSHRAVISALGQQVIKSGEAPVEMHRWLREAFDKRQLGDYETMPILTDSDVRDLQRKTNRFLELTGTLLQRRRCE
jgi:uncharacterized protein (UPF0332 family)